MQNDLPFGHRASTASGALAATSPDAAANRPPMDLPIKIDKELGVSPVPFFTAMLLAILLWTLPAALSTGSLADAVFHSSAGFLDGCVIFIAGLVALLGRNPGRLEVTNQGIHVQTKKTSWFYDWADIDRVVETPNGVRLLVKGRTDVQNSYNLISSRFGLKPGKLQAIISDGAIRFGPGHASPSGRTVCPGDDLRSAAWSPIKRILILIGTLAGAILSAVVVWQALDCLKALDLQQNGRAIEARVVRIYTAGCGKRSCSLNVEYDFTLQSTAGAQQKSYRGYAYLSSSDRPNDPNLIYAKTLGVVPIAYDVRKPSVSSLNFQNRAFNGNPVHVMLIMIETIGGILLIVVGVFLAILTPTILRARRLGRSIAT